MKILVSDIVWDTDGISIDDLPEEVIIDNPTEEMLDCIGGYDDEIADYLSDSYGYCVDGFVADVVEN